ncbi:MAG: HAMP domain-containing protein [Chloroflexi bacterium]|nr:HAMP domain-containing protein [Chloroflexota bacterium]
MRIRHKILLGYLALIAASVVLVVFFLITLSEINNRYSDLINRGQQILLQANNLRSGVQRQIVAARTYEQIGDLSLLVEYEAAVNEQEQAIAQITPLLTQKRDLDTINTIKMASLNYTALARQTMTLARSDKDPITLAAKRQQGETARLALQNATDSLIVKEDQQVADSQAAVKTRVDEVSTQLLLSSLVGVLAAIIAATLLTEGFTAPLRRLMRNIQGISSGDLETAVAVRSTDEIGELAAVLETMRRRLAGASAEKEALLNSAREEAEKLTKAQQELEEANNELQEALVIESEARRHIEEIDRMKSEFASMISHELKTPVSYVYNYAGALKEHNNNLNEGQRTEFLTAIQGEAQHLLTLIDDIMAISLLEAGALKHRFVETDLRKIADSVVKDQQLTTRRHALTTIGPESLPVRADPTRLKQVLNNLLSNAIKYSPQGGAIEVRLRANRLDNTAIIYVRDQGIGIDPADVPKLFDRFTRVQRKETMAIPGSGMGLYIAHHIVEAHGGTLTLQPAPGKGTIAEVTVPLLVERPNSGGDGAQNGQNGQKPLPLADIAHQGNGNGNGNGTIDKEKIAVAVTAGDRDTNKLST